MTTVIRPPAPPREDVTEAEFQQLIVDLARWAGWRTYHTHDSRRSDAGWPDLVLARNRVLLFRELKARRGRMTDDQRDWGCTLLRTGASWAVWRPEDWELILSTLTAPVQR